VIPKEKRLEDRVLLDTYHQRPCTVCRRVGSDPAHIKSRGSGGDDIEWNIMPLCRSHHQEQHKTGWFSFSEKYPEIAEALNDRAWQFSEQNRLFQTKF
jgi:predicted restriction endonuclease